MEEKVDLLEDHIGEPLMGPLEDKGSKARPRSEVREPIPPTIVQDVPQYPVSKGWKPTITGPDAAKYLAYAAKSRAASKGKQRSVRMVGGEDNWSSFFVWVAFQEVGSHLPMEIPLSQPLWSVKSTSHRSQVGNLIGLPLG